MIVRLGYVAISNALNNTTSSTITYTNYQKLEYKKEKVDSVIKSNLEALENIIKYNIKNNFHFYRLTSKLIPLATHKDVNFNYIDEYRKYYEKISYLIKKSNMRVDVHPDQFCVLNSTNKETLYNSIEILKYHYNILKALKIKNKIIILHIGSSVFGKEKSIKRFEKNFYMLPKYIQNCIAIENDDKIYNIDDTLKLCEKLNRPFVLDYHHYNCNKNNIDIKKYYEKIFMTWENIIPKIHFSSPKNKTKKEFRSHSDYINSNEFISDC